MHRDLKPENIMFKSKEKLDSLVIVDFGLADFED
jgi:serine/threonine protein kinase